ncbi:MAG: hypothetical protein ACRDRX_18945 [Pseudonocardiaceae bacterium]
MCGFDPRTAAAIVAVITRVRRAGPVRKLARIHPHLVRVITLAGQHRQYQMSTSNGDLPRRID